MGNPAVDRRDRDLLEDRGLVFEDDDDRPHLAEFLRARSSEPEHIRPDLLAGFHSPARDSPAGARRSNIFTTARTQPTSFIPRLERCLVVLT